MLLTLGASGQSVKLKSAKFTCDFNFLEELNAKLEHCLVSGDFQKQDLNFATGKGFIEAEIATQCSRCGCDVKLNLKIDFNEEFHGGDVEDCYPLSGSQISLDQLIIDKILLNFPTKILCKKDCLGRCDRCGKNLNEGKCDCCEEIELDDPANPFNELKKLKFDRRK